MKNDAGKTIAGTDIAEVKRQNANSGLSYNEINQLLADKLNSADNANRDTQKLTMMKGSEEQ